MEAVSSLKILFRLPPNLDLLILQNFSTFINNFDRVCSFVRPSVVGRKDKELNDSSEKFRQCTLI